MRSLTKLMGLCLLPVVWSACKRHDEPNPSMAPARDADSSNAVVSTEFEERPTPATMVQLNPDGTLVLKAKPRFWYSELGCQELMDSEGRTFPNLFELITFRVAEHSYTVKWSSRTSRKTVSLRQDTEYVFCVKPPGQEGGFSSILEVQDADGKTLYHAKDARR